MSYLGEDEEEEAYREESSLISMATEFTPSRIHARVPQSPRREDPRLDTWKAVCLGMSITSCFFITAMLLVHFAFTSDDGFNDGDFGDAGTDLTGHSQKGPEPHDAFTVLHNTVDNIVFFNRGIDEFCL